VLTNLSVPEPIKTVFQKGYWALFETKSNAGKTTMPWKFTYWVFLCSNPMNEDSAGLGRTIVINPFKIFCFSTINAYRAYIVSSLRILSQ